MATLKVLENNKYIHCIYIRRYRGKYNATGIKTRIVVGVIQISYQKWHQYNYKDIGGRVRDRDRVDESGEFYG